MMTCLVDKIAKKTGKSPLTIRKLAQNGQLPYLQAVKFPGSTQFEYLYHPEIGKKYLGDIDGDGIRDEELYK